MGIDTEGRNPFPSFSLVLVIENKKTGYIHVIHYKKLQLGVAISSNQKRNRSILKWQKRDFVRA